MANQPTQQATVKATIKELEIKEYLSTESNPDKGKDEINTSSKIIEEKTTTDNAKAGTGEQKDETKEAQKVGFKYFVKFAPLDTFSVCEKDYYLGLEKENEEVVFFDVKEKYEVKKEIFGFLSAHQNGIFKFEIENVTTAPDPSDTIPAITSATLIC